MILPPHFIAMGIKVIPGAGSHKLPFDPHNTQHPHVTHNGMGMSISWAEGIGVF